MMRLLLFITLPILTWGDVVLHFRGQFGNQLFQAAAGISLALDHDCQIYFPDFDKIHDPNWGYDRYFQKFWDIKRNYNLIFSRIPKEYLSSKQITPSFIYTEPNIGSVNYFPISYVQDMEIIGYFLSEKYFYRHRNIIKQLFRAPDEIKADLLHDFPWIFEHPKTVAIHVRTAYPEFKITKLSAQEYYKIVLAPDMEFFQNAIELFDPDSLFVVCSDNIGWCKKEFKKLNRNFIFIENQDYLHDFYLMTYCKHAIIAASSFGWWAAYLNTNEEKKIVCRVPFFSYPLERSEDLLCENWVGLRGSENIPLPEYDN